MIDEGAELIVSVWDVLSGATTLSGSVLVFDDSGQAQAPSCAQFLAEKGCEVEIATPDRMIGAEMGSLNFPIFLERFYEHGVTMTPDQRLRDVTRDGNRLKATLRNEYTGKETIRIVDHVDPPCPTKTIGKTSDENEPKREPEVVPTRFRNDQILMKP